MKNFKNISFAVLVAIIAITFSSCKSANDPTPSNQGTNGGVTQQTQASTLDSVKATLVGKWTFSSVTVSKGGISATTSTCEKSELATAGFSDTGWKAITGEGNYTYSNGTTVLLQDNCSTATATLNLSAPQIDAANVKLTMSNGDSYSVNVADVAKTTIKATYINTKGYVVLYTFTR